MWPRLASTAHAKALAGRCPLFSLALFAIRCVAGRMKVDGSACTPIAPGLGWEKEGSGGKQGLGTWDLST